MGASHYGGPDQAEQSGGSWVGCCMRSSWRKNPDRQWHWMMSLWAKVWKGGLFGSKAAATMAMFEFHQLQSWQSASSTGWPMEASPQGVFPGGAQLLGRQGQKCCYGNKDTSLNCAKLCGAVVHKKMGSKMKHSKFCFQGFGDLVRLCYCVCSPVIGKWWYLQGEGSCIQ